MQGNVVETIIGAVVLLTAVFFVLYAYRTAGVNTMSGYVISAEFESVDGLALGSDVRMSGIKIGTVTDMSLDKDSYQAKIEMTISSDVLLYEGTAAKITSSGLLGSQYVSLDPGGGEEVLRTGSELTDTAGAVDLFSLISRFIFSGGGGGSSGSSGE